MDVSHIEMTCPDARGIRCPYTKNEYKVVMHVCGDVVTYSVPKAFSLRTPRRTLKQLMDDASMRGGVRGVAKGMDAATDAHTGEELVLANDRRGYWFENAFDPAEASMDLPEFIRLLSCGSRVISAPVEATSVEHPGELTEDDSDLAHKACEELSQETAEKMVRLMPGVDHGRNTVSMSVPTGDPGGTQNQDQGQDQDQGQGQGQDQEPGQDQGQDQDQGQGQGQGQDQEPEQKPEQKPQKKSKQKKKK